MRTKFFMTLVVAVLASSGASLADEMSAQAKANPSGEAVNAQSTGTKQLPIAQPIVPSTVVSDRDNDADLMICREILAVTGSRLGESRECHTKRDWDNRRLDNQRMIEHAQQLELMFNPKGG